MTSEILQKYPKLSRIILDNYSSSEADMLLSLISFNFAKDGLLELDFVRSLDASYNPRVARALYIQHETLRLNSLDLSVLLTLCSCQWQNNSLTLDRLRKLGFRELGFCNPNLLSTTISSVDEHFLDTCQKISLLANLTPSPNTFQVECPKAPRYETREYETKKIANKVELAAECQLEGNFLLAAAILWLDRLRHLHLASLDWRKENKFQILQQQKFFIKKILDIKTVEVKVTLLKYLEAIDKRIEKLF